MIENKQFEEVVSEGLRRIGLFDVGKLRRNPDGSCAYMTRDVKGYMATVDFYLTFEFCDVASRSLVPQLLVEAMQEKIDVIAASIKASPMMRAAEDRIAYLEKELSKERTERQRLKRYETHFNMSFVLVHGKSSEGVKL